MIAMKVNYYAVAAVSIDGFIARYPGHKSKWTSKEDYRHLQAMENKADVLLLGKTTYETAKKSLSRRNCIVLTSKVNGMKKVNERLVYINPKKASLESFVEETRYKNVCVLGGRGAYNYCLRKNLIDEIWLTIEPLLFGSGIGMFSAEIATRKMRLVSVKKLNKNGTLLLHYKKSK
jgi:dihydrofolate reductase